MKIAITGGTGFVGKHVTNRLLKEGHDVYILTRNTNEKENKDSLYFVQWLTEDSKPEENLPHIDAFINLAGESINSGRWTNERKRRIKESRISSTREVLRIIEKLQSKPKVLINASAIGFYGASRTNTFTEEHTQPGNDFLANTTKGWEEEAAKAKKLGIRTVYTRFGIILGEHEGALPRMVLPYKLFAGGKVGSGHQWLSWIHIDDIVGIISYCLTNESIEGPINAVAPHPKHMDEFGKTIGSVLNKPHWLPVPSFALTLLLGEMSTLILDGQKVLPKKLIEHGYTFKYTDLENALNNLI